MDHYGLWEDQYFRLSHWHTCSACVKEQPDIQRFYKQQLVAGKQLIVFAVDLDKVGDFVKVATLQQSLGLSYPILVDDHFQARTSYHITAVPLAFFLDRQHNDTGIA